MISFIKRYSGFFLLLAGIVGLIVINATGKTVATVVAATTVEPEVIPPTTTSDFVIVDVKGAVYFPGCYRVSSNSRVSDAIQAAGGAKIDADLNQINRSARVVDEMVIYVPTLGGLGGNDDEESPEGIWVDVKGSVLHPDCYQLPAGSRIADAIEAAGGACGDADLSGLNLSAELSDEMVVVVRSKAEEPEPGSISIVPGYGYVAIKGEVIRPGLYVISTNSSLKDLINLAGGLTFNGSVANLDLDAIIVPGSTIQVLSESAAYALLHPIEPNGDDTEEDTETDPVDPQLIDINNADAETLDTLYGIGPVLAQAIIDYRAENGDFESIEDIMRVPGIKTTVYENIKDDIRV